MAAAARYASSSGTAAHQVNAGQHDDRPDLVGQPVGLRPVGDVHGDGQPGRPGRRHADRHGHLQGRRHDARAPARSAAASATLHHQRAGGRHPLDHRGLRRRRQLHHAAPRPALSQVVNQASTTTGLTCVGQPVGLRPVGDVHGDGQPGRPGRRHADAAPSPSRTARRPSAPARSAAASATFTTSALSVGDPLDHRGLRRRRQLHHQHLDRPSARWSTRPTRRRP